MSFIEMLRHAGCKATKARIALLTALSHERYPLSIKELGKKVKAPDQSTLYRTLTTLVEVGLVREISFDPSCARYEITVGRAHHHHAICTGCGFVEDVDVCKESIERAVAKQAKSFASITKHSLEFFGVCKTCTKSPLAIQ